MSKLVAWRTPFASASLPSVWVSVERELRRTVVFVEAEQQWRLHFNYVVGLKVCDETYDDNTRFNIEREERDLCSYFWEDSPWLAEFNADAEVVESSQLTHYVLLGGDYNIEILGLGAVEIEPVIN